MHDWNEHDHRSALLHRRGMVVVAAIGWTIAVRVKLPGA